MNEQTSAANEPLDRVLKRLDEWRHLPAYALERRVDVFIGMFLPEILRSKEELIPLGSTLKVIPEFPLHKRLCEISKEDKAGNLSVNVDFAVFCKEENKLILVELKTDAKSTSNNQLNNMRSAKGSPTRNVLQGVIKVAQTSNEKRKYAHLIWKLLEIECIEIDGTRKRDDGTCESKRTNRETWQNMRLEDGRPGLARHFRSLWVSEKWSSASIELVLIHPELYEDPPKDFPCITLTEAACAIKSRKPLGAMLATYLCRWSSQQAGHINLRSDSQT